MRSTTRTAALTLVLCAVAACGSDSDSDSDSESTAPTEATTTVPAPAATVDAPAGSFTERDLVFATFQGAPLKLHMHFPADPAEAPLVFTSWESVAEGVVDDGAIAVIRADEEEDGIVLCADDIWANHGECLRVADDMNACMIRFARARAAELGNVDPLVVLTDFSAAGAQMVHTALFGATLEDRWDEFATAGGPPRQMECEVTDGTTHVDAVVGLSAVVDMFVPIIDGKYGRAFIREFDPVLQEFLASPVGTDPDLGIRLILGTRDEFPMEFADEFASILADHGYDVQVIPFEGGHELPPADLFQATIREVLGRQQTVAGAFPEGEPVDLVFIADSSSVGVPYAALVEEALGREVRLNERVDENPEAIRSTYADDVAGAEIIVFYHASVRFEQGMPEPQFEAGCLDSVAALEEPDWDGPPWTPGTKWEPVVAVTTAEDWQPYRDWLSEVWEAIWDVRDGRPVVLRGYDVHNPWFGQWVELGIEPECTAVWEGQAQAAREAAEANGATFVSFYDLFNGPGHDEDARLKGWIDEDGMHASDAGRRVAAEALAAVGFELNERPG